MSRTTTKLELRKRLRQRRRTLSTCEQSNASLKLFLKISTHPLFKNAKRIGFYFSSDGEISPQKVLNLSIKLKKACYAAALNRAGDMVFREYLGIGLLETHSFGMTQPNATCCTIAPEKLDLVFVPLVGFNIRGERLGMGGGYYDRTFNFKRYRPKSKPALMGLAHACQKTDELEAQRWDIKMDYICTDEEVLKTR